MKGKISYSDGMHAAKALERMLSPACERFLVAGSLRRQKSEVGDIELVVMPIIEPTLDMFDQPNGTFSELDAVLGVIGFNFTKNGPRYKQFEWEGLSVDLFIATPDTWGCVATIRTGSADFTRWLVTSRRYGGACPSHLKFGEGRIAEGVRLLQTTEEADVFAALELPWIEPVDRVAGRWAGTRGGEEGELK